MKIIISSFLSLIFSFSIYADTTFLMEGNLSSTGSLSYLETTSLDGKYLSIDQNGSFYLVDTNTSTGSNYIEFTHLPFLSTAVNLPTNIKDVVKKVYRQPQTDTYFIVGTLPVPPPGAPPNGGFIYKFDYTPPLDASPTVTRSTLYNDFNVTHIRDIFYLEGTGTYLASGTIFDHKGLNANNPKADLLWLGELDAGLNVQRHYMNGASGVGSHLVSAGLQGGDGNITAIGYVADPAGGSNLFALSLNASKINATTGALPTTANYPPFSTTRANVPLGDIVSNLDGGTHANVYGKGPLNATIQYYPQNATAPVPAPILIPSVVVGPTGPINYVFPYTTTRLANITLHYDGYIAGRNQPWEFLDLNCSGGANPNASHIFVISFNITQLPVNCQNSLKFYESDRNSAYLNLLWEGLGDMSNPATPIDVIKRTPLVWPRNSDYKVYPTYNSATDKVRMVSNKNFLSANGGKLRSTVLYNQGSSFKLIQIKDDDRGLVEWVKDFPEDNKSAVTNGHKLIQTQDGAMIVIGSMIKDPDKPPKTTTDCVVVKVDQYGNEIWSQYLGSFGNEHCNDVVVAKENRKPTYTEYVAVGTKDTTTVGSVVKESWAVRFRDEGVLKKVSYQWNLIGNPTDRNITNLGSIDGASSASISALGVYKYYFMFKDNQWLINTPPIEPLDGFWLASMLDEQEIFLEGDLVEQTFQEIQDGESGWVLLTSGTKLTNVKTVYGLYAVYVYRNGKYYSNPIEIFPGEGFWAKKYR